MIKFPFSKFGLDRLRKKTGDDVSGLDARVTALEEGGTGSTPIIVEVSYDEGTDTYSADKAYSVIMEAIANGVEVYFTYQGKYYAFMGNDNPSAFGRAAFGLVQADSEDHLLMKVFTIDEDEKIVYSQHDLVEELPTVTDADAGKVLTVDPYGIWGAANPASSGSESVRVLMDSSVNPLGNTNPTLTITGYKDNNDNSLTAAQLISKIKSGATAYCIITWESGGSTTTTFAQNLTAFSYVNEDTIVFEYYTVSGGNPSYVLEVCKFTIDVTQSTAQRERSTITGASGSHVSIYFGNNTNVTIPVALRGWSKCKSAMMTGGVGINYLVQGQDAVADIVALDYDGTSKAIGTFLEGTAARRVEFDFNANKVAFI